MADEIKWKKWATMQPGDWHIHHDFILRHSEGGPS